MSTHRSPFTHRRYPLTMVCSTYRVARATVYAQAASPAAVPPPRAKRGPKTPVDDETLIAALRQVLADSPFHGEGHRKMRVRLRVLGLRVGRNRVLRLMRTAGLLAPQRAGHPQQSAESAGQRAATGGMIFRPRGARADTAGRANGVVTGARTDVRKDQKMVPEARRAVVSALRRW